MGNERLYAMSFSKIYPSYVQKVEKKGRTKEEVNQIVFWLLGYDKTSLEECLRQECSVQNFFENAPKINKKASLIKGSICGIRVENVEEELMRHIRYLDKLIDELAKGKSMDKILRS